ncbi:DUF4331 family protein [Dokdonia sp. Hel_I_53]|uniref:DUF4331 family protein n=1 Tax=Dokdonia sp. Hel_I_53 TaxID=1566287 RepID=UPI00119A5143|nr:DUF4331 family protein [Dokdonia sp. Hel_I_53]TVZ51970.1 uncharacterized protein DUF4331 [Dokdonia sp. Hel_I_53]
MKKLPKILIAGALVLGVGALIAADHLDAPAVGGSTADITDYFAFESTENANNTVFVANVQSSLAGTDATFDENVLIEFNIDNDGDLIEDRVIQAIPRDGNMYFFGPYEISTPGLNSTVDESQFIGFVEISTGATPIVTTTNNGSKLFAGPRQDPFFFDFTTYNAVIGADPGDFTGTTGPNGGFKTADNATDSFDGTNVLSIVIEVPNQSLGETFAHPAGTNVQVWNTWVEAKVKQ